MSSLTLTEQSDLTQTLASIEQLGHQCQQAWSEASQIKLPPSYQKVKKMAVVGMGGSALGSHLIKTVFEKSLKIPLEIINHYELPAWLNQETLLFLISYSGTTEEVIAAAQEAKQRKLKTVVITSGGELEKIAKKNQWPAYFFKPEYNPSGQPRFGLGYTLTAQLAILKKLNLIKEKNWEKILKDLWQPEFLSSLSYQAKKLAPFLKNKVIILIGSEHLVGNLHALANQINECAKQLAVWFALPEMNHHLMEGLTFPQENKKYLKFVFFDSSLYHPRVQQRYYLTKKVLKKQGLSFLAWQPQKTTRFVQSLETLLFGSFLSFYLAVLNKVNPQQIPWVNYFKKQLG